MKQGPKAHPNRTAQASRALGFHKMSTCSDGCNYITSWQVSFPKLTGSPTSGTLVFWNHIQPAQYWQEGWIYPTVSMSNLYGGIELDRCPLRLTQAAALRSHQENDSSFKSGKLRLTKKTVWVWAAFLFPWPGFFFFFKISCLPLLKNALESNPVFPDVQQLVIEVPAALWWEQNKNSLNWGPVPARPSRASYRVTAMGVCAEITGEAFVMSLLTPCRPFN